MEFVEPLQLQSEDGAIVFEYGVEGGRGAHML